MFCCSLSVLNMLICVPVSGSRPFRGNLLLHPSCCCYGTLPCPSPLLGATTNHDIARMIPHLHTQGIVPLCQVVSLHKALHPCAIVRRGRLHRTMCHCGHGLHTTTCHVANDANKACPMCLAHVWGVTLKPLSVATPCHLTFLKSLKFPFLLKEHFKPFWRRQHLYLRRHNEF